MKKNLDLFSSFMFLLYTLSLDSKISKDFPEYESI